MRNLLHAGRSTFEEEICIVPLDEEITRINMPRPDFIKIDTEGWEIEVLKGARKTLESDKPKLFLEMHGETIKEKRRKVMEVVTFLWEINYRHICHIETNTMITPENTSVAIAGHLYCQTHE